MRQEHVFCNLDLVLKFYADNFKMKNGEKLYNYDTLIDPGKRTVVFTLMIEEKKE